MATATEMRIVEHLDKTGGATKLELADACFRTSSAISKWLQQMQDCRVIHIKSTIKQGRRVAPIYAIGVATHTSAEMRVNKE